MVGLIAIILIFLWFLGYIHIESFPIPNFQLFVINARPVTLWDLLIFLVVCWAIAILPTPLRQIAGVLLALWTLALFGIIAITGFSQVIVIAIIVGLLWSLFSRRTI
jgi:hypothetical protein